MVNRKVSRKKIVSKSSKIRTKKVGGGRFSKGWKSTTKRTKKVGGGGPRFKIMKKKLVKGSKKKLSSARNHILSKTGLSDSATARLKTKAKYKLLKKEALNNTHSNLSQAKKNLQTSINAEPGEYSIALGKVTNKKKVLKKQAANSYIKERQLNLITKAYEKNENFLKQVNSKVQEKINPGKYQNFGKLTPTRILDTLKTLSSNERGELVTIANSALRNRKPDKVEKITQQINTIREKYGLSPPPTAQSKMGEGVQDYTRKPFGREKSGKTIGNYPSIVPERARTENPVYGNNAGAAGAGAGAAAGRAAAEAAQAEPYKNFGAVRTRTRAASAPASEAARAAAEAGAKKVYNGVLTMKPAEAAEKRREEAEKRRKNAEEALSKAKAAKEAEAGAAAAARRVNPAREESVYQNPTSNRARLVLIRLVAAEAELKAAEAELKAAKLQEEEVQIEEAAAIPPPVPQRASADAATAGGETRA
jgi:hypothetical protein